MNPKIVVVRVSLLDKVDPLREIDQVIEKFGHCWFGKYGRPLSLKAVVPSKTHTPSFAVLTMYRPTRSKKQGEKSETRVSRTYEILEVSKTAPADRKFPSYYKPRIGRISTWLRLGKAETIPIEDLVTKSSAQPVKLSLAYSMAAAFYCRRRSSDEKNLVRRR